MSQQTSLFLMTIGAGFGIGFVYDGFRILRKTIKHSNFLVQVEDIIFWLTVTLLMFYFMLGRNYGEIRFFSIAGAAIGMVLYFCTISKAVRHVSFIVIGFVGKVVFTVLRILLAPLLFAVRLLQNLTSPVIIMLRKTAHRGASQAKRLAAAKTQHVKKQMRIILKKV